MSELNAPEFTATTPNPKERPVADLTPAEREAGDLFRVDQTIPHDDPERPGNCFAACVATAVGLPLCRVPHFVEWGQWFHNESRKDAEDADRKCWWAMFIGYAAGLGLIPEVVDSPDAAAPGELVFVSGPSPRGVAHQVLYRDGQLWHDPHPSRSGIVSFATDDVMYVLRPIPAAGHDHSPTPDAQPEGDNHE